MSWITENQRKTKIVEEADVVVVGGGIAGCGAAIAAARNGAKVTLVEKNSFLGGLATGGLVLLWDDLSHKGEKVIGGIVDQVLAELAEEDGLIIPPTEDCGQKDKLLWDKWGRYGLTNWFDSSNNSSEFPAVEYAASVDPEILKYVLSKLINKYNIKLKLYSYFADVFKEDDHLKGIIIENVEGRQAITGKVFIDATGDGNLLARAGDEFTSCRSSVTMVHRLANIDIDEAIRFYKYAPDLATEMDKKIKEILGYQVSYWWMKSTGEGVVWNNCPTFADVDALNVDELTKIEHRARKGIIQGLKLIRELIPGFASAYLVDTASQIGVRQSRLLKGKHIMSVEDIKEGTEFADSIGRSRNYYIPYSSLLSRKYSNLLVAGRNYSATRGAQFISREVAPCMVMGEGAGTGAALAINKGIDPDEVNIEELQALLQKQGVIL